MQVSTHHSLESGNMVRPPLAPDMSLDLLVQVLVRVAFGTVGRQVEQLDLVRVLGTHCCTWWAQCTGWRSTIRNTLCWTERTKQRRKSRNTSVVKRPWKRTPESARCRGWLASRSGCNRSAVRWSPPLGFGPWAPSRCQLGGPSVGPSRHQA